MNFKWVVVLIFTAFVALVWFASSKPVSASVHMDFSSSEIARVLQPIDSKEILSDADGLTLLGYELFFPRNNPRKGLEDWQKWSPMKKMVYLQEKGSPLVRGLWADSRNKYLIAEAKKRDPDVSDEVLDEALGNLGVRAVSKCIVSKMAHEDVCILIFDRIADHKEIKQAQWSLAWYKWYVADRARALRNGSAAPAM